MGSSTIIALLYSVLEDHADGNKLETNMLDHLICLISFQTKKHKNPLFPKIPAYAVLCIVIFIFLFMFN